VLPVFSWSSAWTSMPVIQVSGASSIHDRLTYTLFEQNALKQRVLIPQHEAFVGGSPMALLETGKRVFVLLDGGLELLDVLCSPLSERGLCLSVALLSLLRGCVDLRYINMPVLRYAAQCHHSQACGRLYAFEVAQRALVTLRDARLALASIQGH